MYKTILLPIDLNEEGFSHLAAEHASTLAKISGATVHLLSVLPTSQFTMVSAYFPEDALKELKKETQRSLKQFAAKHIDEGVKIKLHIHEGKPWKEIIKTANTLSADLIIMPSHKRARLDLAVMGSVASKVVTAAPMNVMVIKPEK